MNIDDEEPNCNICFEPFDDEEHMPRTLRCGHTLCTPCIDVLVKKNLPNRICPECRKFIKISNSSHLPVSYTILRLSRALAKGKPVAESMQVQVLDNNTCMQHGAPTISWCPLSDKWHCFKCIHSDKCESLLSIPEAFLRIKQNYSETLEGKLANAENLKDSLENEKEALCKQTIASEERVSEIKDTLDSIDEWTEKLETDEAMLVEAATTIRLTKSVARLKRDVSNFDAWLERSKPSVKSRIIPPLTKSSCDNIKALTERLMISQVMYAVLDTDIICWSKLSVDGDHLLMHALESDPPPTSATVIPYRSVMDALDRQHPLAFFELECDHHYEGRVTFEMFGNTLRAQQFLKMCTGEEGMMSYKECPLKEFEEDHHRFIRGGLPSNVINSGAIIDGIREGGVYRKQMVPGILNGWKTDSDYWSVFDVVLECKPGYEDDYCFGKVRQGLSLLKGLCENDKKKVIEVRDCGVMLEIK